MKKALLILSLLIAVPAVSEKAKSPAPAAASDELNRTIKNLEETVVEQEERLRIHKQEIEALRKTIRALETRLDSLEKGTTERYATSLESARH